MMYKERPHGFPYLNMTRTWFGMLMGYSKIKNQHDLISQECGYWMVNQKTGKLEFTENPRHLKFYDYRKGGKNETF